jgi:hypothetical protein
MYANISAADWIYGDWSIADLTHQEYELNKDIAYKRYAKLEQPTYSTGVCDSTTAGYGALDKYGYWEYPLEVDQGTLEIIPREEN